MVHNLYMFSGNDYPMTTWFIPLKVQKVPSPAPDTFDSTLNSRRVHTGGELC